MLDYAINIAYNITFTDPVLAQGGKDEQLKAGTDLGLAPGQNRDLAVRKY